MMPRLLMCLLIAISCLLTGALIFDAWRKRGETNEAGAGAEEKTRLIAYEIWEAEGRPDGARERHWNRAVAKTASDGQLSSSTAIEKLQFQSDVAEVQLLLDFISGRPDLALDDPPAVKPGDGVQNTATTSGGNSNYISDATLKKMAELRYPPDPKPGKSGEDVAFLLEFRDHLNRLVAPASGLTVAFTLMTWTPFVLWTLATLAWVFGYRDPKDDWARWSLAKQAYPRMLPSVFYFNVSRFVIILLAITVAFLSLWSSHEVADGQARMSRVAALDQQRAQLIVTIEQLSNIVPITPPAASSTLTPATTQMPKVSDASVSAMLCGRINAMKTSWQKLAPTQEQVEAGEACDDLQGVTKEQWTAYDEIGEWWHGWKHSLLLRLVGWIRSGTFVLGRTAVTDGSTAVSQGPPDAVYSFLEQPSPTDPFLPPTDTGPTLLAGQMSDITKIWLPALYGLVGAVIAALRSIYTKISMSTLAPWDTQLMWTRVILGTLAGTCVGLFFSPDGTTVDGAPGIGNLSLSALAFLAGYAVDGLFAVLDDLIQRVFHGGGATPAAWAKRVGGK